MSSPLDRSGSRLGRPDLHVIKLGSSVLPGPDSLAGAVHEVERLRRLGDRVVVVVSAFGRTTDRLVGWVDRHSIDGEPADPHAAAALLATGEMTSASLLTLTLNAASVGAELLEPSGLGLRTEGSTLAGEPVSVDGETLLEATERGVVVTPGFLGVDSRGRTTLLGRGGSDLTALFLAHALGGRCTLYKDTDGVYTRDPNRYPEARRFVCARWGTVGDRGGDVVQPRGLGWAAERDLEFSIRALGSGGEDSGTLVGFGPDRLATSTTEPSRPVQRGAVA